MNKFREIKENLKNFICSARTKLVVMNCALPALIIFGTAWFLVKDIPLALIVSLATAFMGWTNSIILNSLNFTRAEASKGRDASAQYIEKLFDEIDELLRDRSLREDKFETILTARVSILELRLLHLNKRTGLILLNNEYIANLRSKPLDFIQLHYYQRELINLKFEYLNDVERNYSSWVK